MSDAKQRKRQNGDEYNGPQRAVDAMSRGEDPNENRRRKGAEYGMPRRGEPAAPARTVTPAEAWGMAKEKVRAMRRKAAE